MRLIQSQIINLLVSVRPRPRDHIRQKLLGRRRIQGALILRLPSPDNRDAILELFHLTKSDLSLIIILTQIS